MEEKYMSLALLEAHKCKASCDVPVGCVIVKDGCVIATGHNTKEKHSNALGHAEINAINEACLYLSSSHLGNCSLYVTLEPCPMCAGAIINSRISNVYFGAYDPKGGAGGGVLNLFYENFNHKPKVVGGIMEADCKKLLQDFFKDLR